MTESGLQQQATAEDAGIPSHVTLPAIAALDVNEQRIGRVLLAIALLSGIVLVIPGLMAGPLVLDEHGTFWLAGRNNPLTLWERSLNYENIPPLSPLIHRVFMDLLGESEFVFRLPSALWYLAAIGISWQLGRDLIGPVAAGLIALVVAWHPNALGELHIARCYALTYVLGGILLWTTLRWLKFPGQMRWGTIWCLAASGLLWTHYLNAAAVALSVTLLATASRVETLNTRLFLIAMVLIVGISSIPLYPALLRMSVWGESFGFQAESPLLELLTPLWWLGLPIGLILGWATSRITPQKTSVYVMQVPRSQLRLLICWGLLPTLAAAVLCRGELASLANPRYRISFEIAAACLLVALLCRRRSVPAAIVAVMAALIVSWAVAERFPWTPKRLGTPQAIQWKQLAEYVQAHGVPTESLFVQSGLGEGFLVPDLFDDPVLMDYAACRLGRFYLPTPHKRYALPFLWQVGTPVMDYFTELTAEISLSETPSLWLTAATDTDLNRGSMTGFQSILARNKFTVTETLELPDCVVMRYQRLPAESN